MTVILIETDDGEERIVAINQSSERALQAHGYDPDKVDWSETE